MLLSDVRDWLKTLGVAEHYYIGRLENKQEKSLGVYNRNRGGNPVIAIGGLEASKYDIKSVTLLLHWNQNARETEIAAQALWNALLDVTNLDIGNEHVDYLALLVPEPVAVLTDSAGIYEYVIDFDLYYRR